MEGKLPTNELYFGVLRAERVHGGYLPQAEGVDLFSVAAESILWRQVLLHLWPDRQAAVTRLSNNINKSPCVEQGDLSYAKQKSFNTD